MYEQRDTEACLRNHYCNKNITMRSMCIIELRVSQYYESIECYTTVFCSKFVIGNNKTYLSLQGPGLV